MRGGGGLINVEHTRSGRGDILMEQKHSGEQDVVRAVESPLDIEKDFKQKLVKMYWTHAGRIEDIFLRCDIDVRK